MQTRQQPKNPVHTVVPKFKFYPVKLDVNSSRSELVSSLKRLITEAQVKAEQAKKEGESARHADLRITMAFASQKLKDFVDGKISGPQVDDVLRFAIEALDSALHD